MVIIRRRLGPKDRTSRSGSRDSSGSGQPSGTGALHGRPGGGSKGRAPVTPITSSKGQEFWQADSPVEILDDLVERGVVDVPEGQIIEGESHLVASDTRPANEVGAIMPYMAKRGGHRTYGHEFGTDPAISPSGQWLEWVPKFLTAFRATGVVRRACEAAGVNRLQYARLVEKSPVFKAAVEHAYEDSLDALEALAYHRAMTASDDLLKFMLRGGRRKFRESNSEVTVKGTGPGGSIPLLLIDSILADTKEMDAI